jgi:hypothetical protein
MKRTTETDGAATAGGATRVRVVKRHRRRRDLPPLDLRTPSGKRTLPY